MAKAPRYFGYEWNIGGVTADGSITLGANRFWRRATKAVSVSRASPGRLSLQRVRSAEPVVAAEAEARGGVYLLRDAETGQVVRTGRTNDLAVREAQHARDPLLKDYEFEPVYRTDVYAKQRGLEQNLDWIHNPPLNYGNPIRPKHPVLHEYMDAAWNYLNRLGIP